MVRRFEYVPPKSPVILTPDSQNPEMKARCVYMLLVRGRIPKPKTKRLAFSAITKVKGYLLSP